MYHYTTEKAVTGVLKNKRIVLWLRKADCFDDTTEGMEIYQHLHTACSKLLEAGRITSEQHRQITNLKNIETYPLQYPTMLLGNEGNGYIKGHNNCTAYVMSFCEKPDSEYMWKEYAQQECCLHFNRDILDGWFPRNIECYKEIREVTYKNEDKVSELQNLILDSLTRNNYLQYIVDGININRYFYKKSVPFYKEKEIRLLFAIPQCPRQTTYVEQEFHKNPSIKVEIASANECFVINGLTIGNASSYEHVKRHLNATNHSLVQIHRKGDS